MNILKPLKELSILIISTKNYAISIKKSPFSLSIYLRPGYPLLSFVRLVSMKSQRNHINCASLTNHNILINSLTSGRFSGFSSNISMIIIFKSSSNPSTLSISSTILPEIINSIVLANE